MVYFNKEHKGVYCMKNWKHFMVLAILAVLGIVIGFSACDNGDTHTHDWQWVVTNYASYNTDGIETETCECGATNGTRPIPHPTPTEFPDIVLFETYTATIKDERSTCGSQNLEQLGIVTQIEIAISETFDNLGSGIPGNVRRARFRGVFGQDGGVTIIVNNPINLYKLNVPDQSTIYIHINYLINNSDDIQQNIIDAITAMHPDSQDLPFYRE